MKPQEKECITCCTLPEYKYKPARHTMGLKPSDVRKEAREIRRQEYENDRKEAIKEKQKMANAIQDNIRAQHAERNPPTPPPPPKPKHIPPVRDFYVIPYNTETTDTNNKISIDNSSSPGS